LAATVRPALRCLLPAAVAAHFALRVAALRHPLRLTRLTIAAFGALIAAAALSHLLAVAAAPAMGLLTTTAAVAAVGVLTATATTGLLATATAAATMPRLVPAAVAAALVSGGFTAAATADAIALGVG
jgi:hypothetical protein